MPVTVSFTLSDADAARVVEVAGELGYEATNAGAKQMVADLVRRTVQDRERLESIQSFNDTNVPVSPT